MEKIGNFGTKIMTALIAVVCILQVVTAASAAGPSMTVDIADVSPGDTFTINVTVDPGGEEVYCAQYALSFDPAILCFVEQTKGDFLVQDGADTILVINRLNNESQKLQYGETRMGVQYGVTGEGVLATITFEAVSAGSTDLLLSDVILGDTSANSIDGVLLNCGAVNVRAVSPPPTSPSVSVGSLDVSLGDTFTIDVAVDPQDNSVYGAQYDLAFNPAILRFVEQTKGNFLSQDGADTIVVVNRLNDESQMLEYGETRMGAKDGVTGAGLLARITFEVVSAGSTDLLLSGVILADPHAGAIDGVVLNNGTVNVETTTPMAIVTIPDVVAMGAITVPITIEDASNVGTCQLTLSYDPDVVIVSSISSAHPDSDFDLLFANLGNAAHGSVGVIAYQGASPGLSGDVNVADVTFMVMGPVGSTTPLNMAVATLTDATPDCNRITCNTRDGSFTVLPNGDVNGDGRVDAADGMYLAQHLLGASGFEAVASVVADVNGNGLTEASDCMYLAKHLAGIGGFEVLK